MARANVIIQTQFAGIHCWPGCPHEEVSFLKQPHRHVFHVKVVIPVQHTDRDVEFIMKKAEIDEFIKSEIGTDIGSNSCEDIALILLERFEASYVSVLEDGENGGEVYAD